MTGGFFLVGVATIFISGMSGSEAMKAFIQGLEIMIIPTSGVLMAMLGLAEIPYEKWVKFMLPLFITLCLVAFAILGVAVFVDY